MSDSGEAYVERSPLVQLLQTATRVKLLDALMRKHYMPLDAEQLAEYTDVSRTTVDRNIDVFIEFGLVEEVDVGSSDATHFKIDTDNPVVQYFREAQTRLLDVDGMEKDEIQRVDKQTALEVSPPEKGLTDTKLDQTPWDDSNGKRHDTVA